MAVNKNFVVKNGLEVNTNLIVADATNNKVGIASTAPRFELDVAGGIGATDVYVSGVSTAQERFDVGTGGNVLSVIAASGGISTSKVGIGTTSPAYQLSLSGDGTNMMQFDASTDAIAGSLIGRASSADLRIQQSEAANIVFWTSNNERMRITSDAYLLVGTTSTTVNTTNFGTRIGGSSSPTLKSFRNAGAGSTCCAFGGNAGEAIVKGDGDLENTNNSYGGISDERVKSNIADASSQIDDIMAVQVRSYTLNATGDTHIGVVAQELEASGMSGLVKTKDDGMKSVKYSILYMKAIKALQEAVTRIETLEAEVAALKGA